MRMLVLIAVTLAAVTAPGAAAQQRPNILLIESDDQTLESLRVMDRTRALLQPEGTTFTNAFASFALCCPSRATTLTGQYAHNHGVLSNRSPTGGYYKLNHANTLPVWLQRAGYATVHVGKYLNGYGTQNQVEVPPGWTEWQGLVDPTTYRFYNYTLNDNATLRSYGNDPASDYQTDVLGARAVDVVRRRAAAEQPFFLWLAFLAPHSGQPREADDPRVGNRNFATPAVADRHRDRFATEPVPRPPSYNEADVSDKPASIRNRPPLGAQRQAAIDENYRQRLESLLAIDEWIDRVVAALRETGELDRTLIVFTSDNGFFHGEHRVPQGKVLVYEPSIRIPMLMRGPGVPAGRTVTQKVMNVDVAATVAAAAGARPGRVLDGIPLQSFAQDPGFQPGRDVLIEGPQQALGQPLQFTALRTDRYVWVEHATGERELYDLAGDPHQLASRHADPATAALRYALHRRLERLRTCRGSRCRSAARVSLELVYTRARARGRVCARRRVLAWVMGTDRDNVRRVEFTVNGRNARSRTRAPFRVRYSARTLPAGRVARVRARITLDHDRLLTLDRRVRVCG